MAVVPHPSPEVVVAVNEQVTWWLSRGVTAQSVAAAMGVPASTRWETIRREMEAWMMMRRGA